MTPRLSARELEVLALMAEGLTSAQIGARLWLSENTIKGHRKRIHAELGATSRIQAVSVALQHGLINEPATTR